MRSPLTNAGLWFTILILGLGSLPQTGGQSSDQITVALRVEKPKLAARSDGGDSTGQRTNDGQSTSSFSRGQVARRHSHRRANPE